MTSLTHSDAIVIVQNPAVLYDMIADITRMGEWSPIRTRAAHDGIPATLPAIKRAAEAVR